MSPHFFSGNVIDRASVRRRDVAWLSKMRADPAARVVEVSGSNALVHGDPPRAVRLAVADVESLGVPVDGLLFLGLEGETPVFAASVPKRGPGASPSASDRLGSFEDLKRVGPLMGRDDSALLAYARSLFNWNDRYGHCSTCGSPTLGRHGGHLRVCENPACEVEHSPRTDPAIITLVTHGERCLLVRGNGWPPRRYATVAGFLDPGESLEEAVIREVKEETGLAVTSVRYHSSQSWPFPGTIMIGFNAEVDSDELYLDGDELVDGIWFTRASLRDALRAGTLLMPMRVSISNRLVEEWYLNDPPEGSPTLFDPS